LGSHLSRVKREPHDHHLRALRTQLDVSETGGCQRYHPRGRYLEHDQCEIRDDYLHREVTVGSTYRRYLALEHVRHGSIVAGELVDDHQQHCPVETFRPNSEQDDGQQEHAYDEVRERLERLFVVGDQHRSHCQPRRDYDRRKLNGPEHRFIPGQVVRGRVEKHAPSDAKLLERRQNDTLHGLLHRASIALANARPNNRE